VAKQHQPIPSPLVFSYEGTHPDQELLGWIRDGQAGGVVLFRENCADGRVLAESVAALRTAGGSPLRVMIDEEGERVRRLPDHAASMRDLRSYESEGPNAVASACSAVAQRLQALDIDTLLAPVVDVGSPSSPWLLSRTYSDSAASVAQMAALAIPAIQRHGVTACAKHFPGTRSVVQDTHLDAAIGDSSMSDWEHIDARPFQAAIDAGVDMIMVGHQRMLALDAARPASLSPIIVQTLLRDRLGFGGLVLTDDLAMGAITRRYSMDMAIPAAVDAGCDCLLVCQNRQLQRQALVAYQQYCQRTSRSESTT
jgi:beta-N-acetylhexosaminidase